MVLVNRKLISSYGLSLRNLFHSGVVHSSIISMLLLSGRIRAELGKMA
jgi:hypothetical protein